jgi:pSer/pThr/pTyr-binding forkhead associated (FHA) protein
VEIPPFKTRLRQGKSTDRLSCDFDTEARYGPYFVRLHGYIEDERDNPVAFWGQLRLRIRNPEEKKKIHIRNTYGLDLAARVDLESTELVLDEIYGASLDLDATREPIIQDKDGWIPIRLEEDIDRTETLIAWQEREQDSGEINGGNIDPQPASNAGAPVRKAVFNLSTGSSELTTVIWTPSECRIGRSPELNDIACMLLPCNETNNQLSECISRRHLRLAINDANVIVEDLGSANGTFVDGQRIEGPTKIHSNQVINLGHALNLRYRDFRRVQSTRAVNHTLSTCSSLNDCASKVFDLDMETLRRQAPIDAFVLRRINNYRDRLQYLFLLDNAVIGASRNAAICLPNDSLDKRHARLILKNGSLYIEDLDSQNGTYIDGRRMESRRPEPVGTESTIRFGAVEGQLTTDNT